MLMIKIGSASNENHFARCSWSVDIKNEAKHGEVKTKKSSGGFLLFEAGFLLFFICLRGFVGYIL